MSRNVARMEEMLNAHKIFILNERDHWDDRGVDWEKIKSISLRNRM
jgi:hypothetical protein